MYRIQSNCFDDKATRSVFHIRHLSLKVNILIKKESSGFINQSKSFMAFVSCVAALRMYMHCKNNFSKL